MQLTAAAQEGYKATTRPVTEWLIRAGVRPNTITTVGALVVIASAVAFGVGAMRLGAGLLLLSGVIDTLDGDVAR
ncbi:MAG TPA: CDP-alcohol phosphatidyltransferase family protein, partial [Gemmatimonadales bacterium]|nr:CDP-alcohol phosphatidyltransferase family protein [Gemmatimonadales bacterium]